MDLVAKKLDVFLIYEAKIDGSFSEAPFLRFLGGGGLFMYVNENIHSRILNAHIIPDDVEILCVEMKLKKAKMDNYRNLSSPKYERELLL